MRKEKICLIHDVGNLAGSLGGKSYFCSSSWIDKLQVIKTVVLLFVLAQHPSGVACTPSNNRGWMLQWFAEGVRWDQTHIGIHLSVWGPVEFERALGCSDSTREVHHLPSPFSSLFILGLAGLKIIKRYKMVLWKLVPFFPSVIISLHEPFLLRESQPMATNWRMGTLKIWNSL